VGKDLAEPVKWEAGDWHRRFTLQARWTEQIRQYCVNQLNLEGCQRILEVGCGTGVISTSLQRASGVDVYGLDIRQDFLGFAKFINPAGTFIQGDAFLLPFGRAVSTAPCVTISCCGPETRRPPWLKCAAW